jgi:type IV secretory pathway TrbD component
MSTTTRRLVLHPSLVRPNLLAGGDRHLTILLWTSVFALIFGAGIRPLSIAVGMALGILGQMGLIRAAHADPHWFLVYRRHVRYQHFYPAHSRARADSAPVQPSVSRSR